MQQRRGYVNTLRRRLWRSVPHKTGGKPCHQIVEPYASRSGIDDKVIDRLIIGNIQPIAAAVDQKLGQKPCSSLVGVHEPMVPHHAVQKGSCLSRNRPMIAGIRTRQGGFDQVKAADARAAAIDQGFVMRGYRIGQGDAVMPPTDRPASLATHCVSRIRQARKNVRRPTVVLSHRWLFRPRESALWRRHAEWIRPSPARC